MKRLALIGIIATILAAAGAHWYVADQVENALERLSGYLAPLGELTWSTTRVDPRGHVTIQALRFQPHDHRDPVRVDHLTIDTHGLRPLLRIERLLDTSRWPSSLSIHAEGLYLPVNPQIDAWFRSRLPPSGLIAAGCPPIDPFRFDSLSELGWWELLSDLGIAYSRSSNDGQLAISANLLVDGLGEMQMRASLAMANGDPATEQPVIERVALDRAEILFINHGFVERLIDYCSNDSGVSADRFRSAHLQAWEKYWQSLGLQPGRLALAGYRHFLDQPDTLSLTLDPEPAVGLAEMTVPWRRPGQGATFSVNGGTAIELSLEPTARAAALSPDPAAPEAADATPATQPPADAAREASPSIPGRTLGPAPQWQSITAEEAEEFIGFSIRIELIDGSRYSGRLVDSDDEQLHLSIRTRLGQIVRPLPRAEMIRIEIRP